MHAICTLCLLMHDSKVGSGYTCQLVSCSVCVHRVSVQVHGLLEICMRSVQYGTAIIYAVHFCTYALARFANEFLLRYRVPSQQASTQVPRLPISPRYTFSTFDLSALCSENNDMSFVFIARICDMDGVRKTLPSFTQISGYILSDEVLPQTVDTSAIAEN